MKPLIHLAPVLLLIPSLSCSSLLVSHRMKAAGRKLQATSQLQQEGRWEEALDMNRRMHASVSKSVQSLPRRPGASGAIIDLRPLLAAWQSGPWSELQEALQRHDDKRSQAALRSLRQQCINCHAVAGKPQLQVPELP
jgi:hypothetical protein